MSGFVTVGFFLFYLFFGFIIFSLWTRIALRYLRISALTPFSQLISTITDPLVQPLNLILRQRYKPGQKYDWMTLCALFVVELIKISCLSLLLFHTLGGIFLLLYLLADLVIQPCNLLFYAILVRVVMSYFNPRWHHSVLDFLVLLTEPLLILGRKIIPNISGFDFSPIVILILLKVIILFISASLPWNLL